MAEVLKGGQAQQLDKAEKILGGTVNQAVKQQQPEKQHKAVPKLKPHKAEDFNGKEIAEVMPIIGDGLLYPGLALLASPPKMGKSYLALDLAVCVASGQPFLSRQVCRSGSVLYVDLEGKLNRTQLRLREMGVDSVPDKLEIVFSDRENDIRRVDSGFLEQLEQWLSEHPDAVLVVVDMFRSIDGRTGLKENDYEAKSRSLGLLQNLALNRDISILCLMHTRKGNGFNSEPQDVFEQIIGSVGQFATADCAWMITGKRKEQRKTFSVLCRDSSRGEETYEIAFSNFHYRMLGTKDECEEDDKRKQYETDSVVFTIKKLLETDRSWSGTASELSEEVLKLTGEYIGDSKKAGNQIRNRQFMLLKNDGIETIFPGRNGGRGRVFTFKRSRTPKQERIDL